jgi:hypothetical protein
MKSHLATLLICTLLTLSVVTQQATAKEWFVTRTGSDQNDGASIANAFATIQQGISKLEPGDILTIGPGEYTQTAFRKNFGSLDKETLIRAQIPGTVLIRGDIKLPPVTKVEGYRFIYVTDCDQPVNAVNELDTLTVLDKAPIIAELDAGPGRFYHDAKNKKLYISATNFTPATAHHYSASVVNLDGLYFLAPKRLTIEGLSFTGFNSTTPDRYHPPYRTRFSGSETVWGLLMTDPQSCVIRNCTAYLNGGGLGIEHGPKPEAIGQNGNLIDRCVAYGNYSQLSSYLASPIGVYSTNNDEIRDCYSYLNRGMGARFYILAHSPGKMTGTIAWGNTIGRNPADIHIKSDPKILVDRSVAMSFAQVQNVTRSIIPRSQDGNHEITYADNNIFHSEENKTPLDLDANFADAVNMDFRLQADSKLRGTASEGKDPGPHQYAANVFFVSDKGDDKADGLSVKQAFKTLARATKNLKAGDTLYIISGKYDEKLTLTAKGTAEQPISIRSRGIDKATITGTVKIDSSAFIDVQRLVFAGDVTVKKSSDVSFSQCGFYAKTIGLQLVSSPRAALRHNNFTTFSKAGLSLDQAEDVFLSSNRFNNSLAPAVRSDSKSSLRYSDYNGFAKAERAWEKAGDVMSLAQVQKVHDVYSRHIAIDEGPRPAVYRPEDHALLHTIGALGKTIGTYRDQPRREDLSLVQGPEVHSVSATTANIEWMTSLPTYAQFAWGETPECTNTGNLTYDYLGSYSLTGLTPGKTYYFRLTSINESAGQTVTPTTKPTLLRGEPISFTTLKTSAAPVTYYVAPDGNDTNPGTTREKALRNVQRAADLVNAGDTVLIAAGKYTERVRIRATGDTNAPITFRNITGEKVIFDGAGRSLGNTFVVLGKSDLKFDGFYTVETGMVGNYGEFYLMHAKNIDITRIFADGRGNYPATFSTIIKSENVLIKNTVNINRMGSAIYVNRSPNVRVENTVFANPMIASHVVDNTADQKVTFRNNIFTDMLAKKAAINAITGEIEDFRAMSYDNNSFLIITFPPDKRLMFGDVDHAKRQHKQLLTLPEYDAKIAPTNSIFADPQFAAVIEKLKAGVKPTEFPPDLLMDPPTKLDFNSYFTTNPELIQRGIGLDPKVFAEFNFTTSQSPGK